MKRISLRIPEEMNKAVDKYLKKKPSIINKSDALRDLIYEGLVSKEVI